MYKRQVSAEESLQVVRLQKALKEAVSKEDYESAARYRAVSYTHLDVYKRQA